MIFLRQIEEAENQVSAINRIKSQLGSQIEDLRRQLDQESRDRQTLASQVRDFLKKTLKSLNIFNLVTAKK